MKRGSGCCAVDIYCTAALTPFSDIKLHNIFIFGMAYSTRDSNLMYVCTLVLFFGYCPMFLGIEFSANKLIFACLIREK